MPLVIDSHREALQSVIGAQIDYGIAPSLCISDSATYPADECYGRQYGPFFESPLLNLRLTTAADSVLGGGKNWLVVSPGPDEPIADWAPFSAHFAAQPNLLSNTTTQLPNDWDRVIQADGYSRMSCWTGFGPIKSIELFGFTPYAACVVTHHAGSEWCMYAE